MGLIASSLTQNLLDRIAAQQQLLRDAFLDVASGDLGFYVRIHDFLDDKLGDPDIEGDLVSPADDLDKDYQSGTTIGTIYSSFLRALTNHMQAQGATSIDQFLTDNDVNVHEDFHPAFEAVFGGAMQAINVFRKTPIKMGSVAFVGSGVCTFTDAQLLGTGTGTFDANSNSAASELEAVVASGAGVGVTGGVDILLKVVGTDESGTQVIASTLTISAGTALFSSFDVPGAGTLLDVTSVQCHGGSSGDAVLIRQKIEREPQL